MGDYSKYTDEFMKSIATEIVNNLNVLDSNKCITNEWIRKVSDFGVGLLCKDYKINPDINFIYNYKEEILGYDDQGGYNRNRDIIEIYDSYNESNVIRILNIMNTIFHELLHKARADSGVYDIGKEHNYSILLKYMENFDINQNAMIEYRQSIDYDYWYDDEEMLAREFTVYAFQEIARRVDIRKANLRHLEDIHIYQLNEKNHNETIKNNMLNARLFLNVIMNGEDDIFNEVKQSLVQYLEIAKTKPFDKLAYEIEDLVACWQCVTILFDKDFCEALLTHFIKLMEEYNEIDLDSLDQETSDMYSGFMSALLLCACNCFSEHTKEIVEGVDCEIVDRVSEMMTEMIKESLSSPRKNLVIMTRERRNSKKDNNFEPKEENIEVKENLSI